MPQEQSLHLTRALLEEMQSRPPDTLVMQTHAVLIRRDLALIHALARHCELWVLIMVETDMEHIQGFPPHASSPAKRIAVLKEFRDAGVQTQVTISPLLPIASPETFARHLEEAFSRVIVDHYLLGDGSPGGLRTKWTNFLPLLERAGFREWTSLDKLWEIRDVLCRILGVNRVLMSRGGFTAVGGRV